MQFLNPSTAAKLIMIQLQNLFAALVNMDIIQMTLKLISFTKPSYGTTPTRSYFKPICSQASDPQYSGGYAVCNQVCMYTGSAHGFAQYNFGA